MDIATFNAATTPLAGHLIWTGARTHDGYPVRGRTYIHRWAYEQFIGPIPEGHEVDHTCEIKTLCVEPAHLEAVTPEENKRRIGERVTSCRNGHEYTPSNTYRSPKTGRKSCRICRKVNTQAFFDKNPGYSAAWYREKRRRTEG